MNNTAGENGQHENEDEERFTKFKIKLNINNKFYVKFVCSKLACRSDGINHTGGNDQQRNLHLKSVIPPIMLAKIAWKRGTTPN